MNMGTEIFLLMADFSAPEVEKQRGGRGAENFAISKAGTFLSIYLSIYI